VEEAILASPQAIQLTQSLFASEDKLNEVRRRTRNNSDPTLKKAVDEHQALVAQYDQLWQTMYPNIKARISATWSPTATPLVVAHDPEPFQRIGHSLFALLSALLGGMIAVRFHHTRDTTPCPSDDNSPTNRSTT
jgi:outer membrane protein TolC